jgi:hypothetical protein
MQAVAVTGRLLSLDAKRSKTTAFCFFCILFSAKKLETTELLVWHSHQEMENDRFKKKNCSVPIKKNPKLEFRFDCREHSLQVSVKSVEGNGCSKEWAN